MSRVLIRGGTVYDGTGAEPVVADVLVEDDRIVHVGPRPGPVEADVIDATGRAVAPGFVNVLSHAWAALRSDGTAASDLVQGVTTEIFGEGFSPGPSTDEFGTYLGRLFGGASDLDLGFTRLSEGLDDLERRGLSVNVASLIGGTNLRFLGAGFVDRPLTPAQLGNLQAVVEEEMHDGALGIGTALIYPPGSFAVTAELVELCKPVAEYGGLYASHLRSEGDALLDALDELISIGKQAQVRTEVFHLKAAGRDNHHKMALAVRRLNAERAAGTDVAANMYPYDAGATQLLACIPPRYLVGGPTAVQAMLLDPAACREIRREIEEPGRDFENLFIAADAGAGIVFLSDLADGTAVRGRSVLEVALEWDCSAPEVILEALRRDLDVGVAYHMISEPNIRLGLSQPWVSVGSDGAAHPADLPWTADAAHPRTYGTFARMLGHYGREEGLFTTAEGIRRMTSLPATRFGLRSRGEIREGYFADLVVLDAGAYAAKSTYLDPHQYAYGVDTVLVNGRVALSAGRVTEERPGRRLRRGHR